MGSVRTLLYAASSAVDTDFTAKLVDVFPDGKAPIVCEGIIRARYRQGLEQPVLLQPGAVERFEIPLGNIAVMFESGHRVRLEISSSNHPRYDANPNTGAEIAREGEPQSAQQQVFHSPQYPSALELPVVRP
jgi:putative CocE/NonD family hydrolase